ncbi:MAG: mechanosensitive ion channel family protein [Chlorobium sp.]|uniref:mechanosensitive ion channel family protein n=1 Tax=Chlorobium sp. TaxID=1095 RepID=UPI0025C07199|nr:mechanosensitive ion channel domain-containing protein [Chlorobium sp.]MCF8215396.1 mechanosensitive ion channel family protein [Chlorobium sp.]MCF8270234.1 mechanosensitive ion channel family protein [Chlorobium sp.]MCF8286603.1 mechanosensitive ion channel family protein [Chlorobium sp.]MCF8290202.1 mechanosensitive ion channel family protein [Chlorobium sp.]MCF8384361.1 mechanosensitive ion channel family protein [Chlorobium sp.]
MDTAELFRDVMRGTYLVPLLIVLLAVLFYLVSNSVFRKVVGKIRASVKESGIPFDLLVWPFRLFTALIGLGAFLHYIPVSPDLKEPLRHALLIVSILGFGWFLLRLLIVTEQFMLQHYSVDVSTTEESRKIATHVSLARKILNVLIVLIAVSGVLMTFDTVRQVGLSILASAGIAGVILGFAAQKSLGTLIAGIQIAITQPIRIGDVVVVESEWGRIEEITLTYVVVALWDQRRLIVPITWFIDRPFENWTRISAELLGTVYIYTDYAIPLDALRRELERIAASSSLWDGRLVKMHVTNTTDKSVEVRALISAANSSDAWELRCLVREQLIEFIRTNYPGGLPKVRMDMGDGGPEAASAASGEM